MTTEPQGGVRGRVPGFLRVLRGGAIALLILSAGLTLVGLPELGDEVAAGRWPRAALALPPTVLALFILGYAAYRLALVRAGRYPAGKALVQIGLMVLSLGVVAGFAVDRVNTARAAADPLPRALRSGDPAVRALAAELARHRGAQQVLPLAPLLVELLEDRSAEVRREAHQSLVVLAGGVDLGAGPDAIPRWRERFPAQR
jgi:hypothetical protein